MLGVICKLDVGKALCICLSGVAFQENGEGGLCGVYQLSNFLFLSMVLRLIFLEALGVFVRRTHYLRSFLILSWRL